MNEIIHRQKPPQTEVPAHLRDLKGVVKQVAGIVRGRSAATEFAVEDKYEEKKKEGTKKVKHLKMQDHVRGLLPELTCGTCPARYKMHI